MHWFLYDNGPRHERVKDCFNQRDYKFDDVSKLATPAFPKMTYSQKRSWRHNFYPWRANKILSDDSKIGN